MSAFYLDGLYSDGLSWPCQPFSVASSSHTDIQLSHGTTALGLCVLMHFTFSSVSIVRVIKSLMQICLFLPPLICTTYEDSPILSPDVPFPPFHPGKLSACL